MKYYDIKQIHSSLSNYSSNDEFLYKEISKEEFDNLTEKKEDVTRRFKVCYTEDKTCCTTKYSSKRAKEIVASLKERYIKKGFGEMSEDLNKAFEDLKKANKLIYIEESKKIGRVFTGELEYEEYTSEIYQGGFSDTIFNTQIIQKYVSNPPYVWGYLGGSERLIEIDKKIEKECFKYLEKKDAIEIISNWVITKEGRRFNDAIDEELTSEEIDIDEEFIISMVETVNQYNNLNIKLKEKKMDLTFS